MITRPLDLASKLRPEPRNFDWLFFVNAGLLLLAFSVFCSRFVLAPGISVDFQLPTAVGATEGALRTTHTIDIRGDGQILTDDGFRSMEELKDWLRIQASATKSPVLLVRAESGKVSLATATEISSAAKKAGFQVLVAADEPGRAANPKSGKR
jgi:biopolymer transport protein ExbD